MVAHRFLYMNKKRFFINYTALFILFAFFNVGYFALYRSAFLLKDGVITDYYLAGVLGLIYAYVPAVAPDMVYDLLILGLVFVSGLTFTLMLMAFGVREEKLLPSALFYMFSGFTVIVGYSHPDLILIMLLLPLSVMLWKKRRTLPALIFTAINIPIAINLIRGDAPACLMRWLGDLDLREICYIAVPVLLLATLAIMKSRGIIEERTFTALLIFFMLFANLITCFFEFSIFEGDGVNALYVNSASIYPSLLSIADILFKGGSL